MCLLTWNWQPGSATPLLLLANRDEFFDRPTQALHWWPDQPILAGRDSQGGGTWLGVDRQGRMAALTNYRLPVVDAPLRPTRGTLVSGFLEQALDAPTYLQAVATVADSYNPFNLLVFDGRRLMGLESRTARVLDCAVGIGAVSNADFDTPWPKLLRIKQQLQMHCMAGAGHAYPIHIPWQFWLRDAELAADNALPNTGVALAWERALSAIFVSPTPDRRYGTRVSSLLRIDHDGVEFREQSYQLHGIGLQRQFHFQRQAL